MRSNCEGRTYEKCVDRQRWLSFSGSLLHDSCACPPELRRSGNFRHSRLAQFAGRGKRFLNSARKQTYENSSRPAGTPARTVLIGRKVIARHRGAHNWTGGHRKGRRMREPNPSAECLPSCRLPSRPCADPFYPSGPQKTSQHRWQIRRAAESAAAPRCSASPLARQTRPWLQRKLPRVRRLPDSGFARISPAQPFVKNCVSIPEDHFPGRFPPIAA